MQARESANKIRSRIFRHKRIYSWRMNKAPIAPADDPVTTTLLTNEMELHQIHAKLKNLNGILVTGMPYV